MRGIDTSLRPPIFPAAKKQFSAAARNAKIHAHWALYPLRIFHSFNSGTVWVATIVTYFALRQLGFGAQATWLALAYLVFAIYSWIAPPLVRAWFNYRHGRIN